jgi:hypothetical protein
VQDDHETFVGFLELYYKWLEESGSPVRQTGMLQDLSDIDKSLEDFYEHFKNQYLFNFPVHLALDQSTGIMASKETLIKNIKDFYGAKGTERAYKFLFRVLYNAYTEFYYPKTDIWRASDGKWIAEKSLKITAGNGTNLQKMITRQIRQRNPQTLEVEAYARVNRVVEYRESRYSVAEVYVSDIYGTFIPDRSIESTVLLPNGDTKILYEVVYPVLNTITVAESGTGYQVDEEITVTTAAAGSGAQGIVGTVGPNGELAHIVVNDFGVGYNYQLDPPSFDITTTVGTNGHITGSVGALCEYAGYWTTNDGKISSTKKMQDNYYYQAFSYVLKTEVTMDVFKKTIKQLTHPAGMKMFGNVLILRDHLESLINRTFANIYEIPLLGHYTPYTFKTWENLRGNSQDVDLYPCGHNPTTGDGPADYSDEFESGLIPHDPTGPRMGDSMEETIQMQFNLSGAVGFYATGNYIIQTGVTGETGVTGVAVTGGGYWFDLLAHGTPQLLTPGYAVGEIIGRTTNATGWVITVDVLSHATDHFHFMTGHDFWFLLGPQHGAGTLDQSLTTGGSAYVPVTGCINCDALWPNGYCTGAPTGDTWPYYMTGPCIVPSSQRGGTGENYHMLNLWDAIQASGGPQNYNCIDIDIKGALSEGEWSGNPCTGYECSTGDEVCPSAYWAIYAHPRVRGITGIPDNLQKTHVRYVFNQPYVEGNDFVKHELVTQAYINPYNNEPVAGGYIGGLGHVISWDPMPPGLLGSELVIELIDGEFTLFGGVHGFEGGAFWDPQYISDPGDPTEVAEIYITTGNSHETQFKHVTIHPFLRILKGDKFDSWGGPTGCCEYIFSGVTGTQPIEDTCNLYDD